MKMKKTILLISNDLVISELYFCLNMCLIHIDLDKINNKEYLVEKYTTVIAQLFSNKYWIHFNTLPLVLYYIKLNNKLLYSILINRVNSFFSFGNFEIIWYNVNDNLLDIIKDINI